MESDVLLRPVEVFRSSWRRGGGEVNLSRDQLLLLIGDASLLDHADASSRFRIGLELWRAAFASNPVNHAELSSRSVVGCDGTGVRLCCRSWWSTWWWRWCIESRLARYGRISLFDCRSLYLSVCFLKV